MQKCSDNNGLKCKLCYFFVKIFFTALQILNNTLVKSLCKNVPLEENRNIVLRYRNILKFDYYGHV